MPLHGCAVMLAQTAGMLIPVKAHRDINRRLPRLDAGPLLRSPQASVPSHGLSAAVIDFQALLRFEGFGEGDVVAAGSDTVQPLRRQWHPHAMAGHIG